MAGVRAQLARTRRLEASKVHPMLAALGGEEGWFRFQVEVQVGLADGRYDRRDMPMVVAAIKSWLGEDQLSSAARLQ